MDPSIFYPTTPNPHPEAVKACAQCPVRSECYLYALKREDHGFWAGHTEQERRKLRKVAGVRLEPWQPDRPVVCGTASGHRRHIFRGEDPCAACKEALSRRKYGYTNRMSHLEFA